MALAGQVSRSVLTRYSHIRVAAKQAAIDALEAGRLDAKPADFEAGSPQNPPQSMNSTDCEPFTILEKAFN